MSDDKIDSANFVNDPESGSVPVPEPMVDATSDTGAMPEAEVTFQGNNYDLMSLIGVTIGGLILASCVTFNMIWYCLPVISIILGAIGLAMAKDSVNPERTRLLSWISLGSGVAILALIILAVIAYIVIIIAVASSNGGF